MSLKEYRRKRNFKVTKEPFGKKGKGKQKYLYVIQKHAASHLHYDFRLELDGVLKSWAVPKGPSLDPSVKRLAMHVEDHPIEYGSFEGIIPEGEYGGGTVMLWDQGYWEPLDEDPKKTYHKGDLTFNLYGKKLKGKWKLIKLKTSKNGKEWLLFKVKDKYSRDEDEYSVTEAKSKSVATKLTMDKIAENAKRIWTKKGEIKGTKKKTTSKKKVTIKVKDIPGAKKSAFPKLLKPELATLVSDPPLGDEWLHEIKWDGYRLLGKIRGSDVRLITRHNKDWTDHFPSISNALKKLKFKNVVFDGEIVALDENNLPNFQILQNSLEESFVDYPLIYYIFDLLFYDGYSLLNSPLIERKRLLEQIILSKTATAEIEFNDHIVGDGETVYANACKLKLEGIISKRIASQYLQKRTRDWLKVKCLRRQEFVIGGYTDPKSSRQYFGALLLGYYNRNHELIYCGKVGTGFTHDSLKEIAQILNKYEQKNSPFKSFPEKNTRGIHWLKSKLVAEIEYLNFTDEGLLRHPSFKGLREDKKAKDVVLELPKELEEVMKKTTKAKKANSKTLFTNLDRVLYPEKNITKGDLIEYYEKVANLILPHVKNRPLTVVRCPEGYKKGCFYQKHVNETVPDSIKSVPILEHGKNAPYIYISNLDGLLGLVQMGVLEIHPWGSTIKDVEKPDRVIFDLDPAPEVPWKEMIKTAHLLHDFLEYLGLKSFVKTTGGKGLHVVLPIRPTLTWDELRPITQRIANLIVEMHPDKYIATMSKAKRTGKIFIDYLRNVRGATAIAPFSTRANEKASVSVTLSWEELTARIKSDSFNVQNVFKRLDKLKTDPWAAFFTTKQSINEKVKKSLRI